MQIRWQSVVRDVLIIFGLTFIGGFIIGFMSAVSGGSVNQAYLGLSNIFFGTVGFAISYVWTKTHRMPHLFAVAGGTWILSIINVFFGYGTIITWIFALIPVLLMMGLGSLVGWGWTSVFPQNESDNRPSRNHHHI